MLFLNAITVCDFCAALSPPPQDDWPTDIGPLKPGSSLKVFSNGLRLKAGSFSRKESHSA